jgi:ABC-2 type transport system ATP-binding protein
MDISIENVTKKYGSFKALDNFSASFSNGVYGLLGPNGAGKSTLINIIVGLLKSNGGSVKFNNKNVVELGDEFLNYIGYLPQYPRFYANFTVYEFMKYMAALKSIPKKESDNRIHELLNFLNIFEHKNKKTSQLSGGMKQRLGIAQALINNPEFLILDEPTAGLDPKERIRFRNLISQLAKDRTVLLATHIVSDVSFIAKEIILLRNGIKVQQDTPEKLIKLVEGKIWITEIESNQLNDALAKYTVSNARNTENGYELRIVSEKHPEFDTVKQATPNLEDVYLYYFGGE